MQDFYNAFYTAVEHSQAHHAFCERVFGRDLCQHGFADLDQLDLLIRVTGLGPLHRALDAGCGNGLITEYLSDRSGAHLTGVDNSPEAIRQARQRAASKADRLDFYLSDINCLDLQPESFDTIFSIDSMYFSEDYLATLRCFKAALKPGGQMALLFSHGREPWVPKEQFDQTTTMAENTPLAVALAACGFAYEFWDLTNQDYELACRRKDVLVGLKYEFEKEGAGFIYNNRMGDANGIMQAIEEGLHARYLYLAR